MNLQPYKWHIIFQNDSKSMDFANKMNDLLDEIEKEGSVSHLAVLQKTIEDIYDDEDIKKEIKQYYENL